MNVEYVPSGIGFFVDRENWWSEDSIFKHNWLLESVVYGKPNMREKLNVRKDVKIMGDSGGFSTIIGKAEFLDPLDVLRWQEKNCDYGFTLDRPPVKQRGNSEVIFDLATKLEAQPALKFTADNATKMLRHKTNDKFKLLFVAHGFYKDYMDSGVQHLNNAGAELKDFDGISISRKGSNPYTMLEQLIWVKDKLESGQHLHVLGISGFQTTPLIHYILKDRKDITITYDSTGYLRGSKRKEYISPQSIKHHHVFNETGLNHTNFCDCPICRHYKNTDINSLPTETDKAIILNLHNLKMFLNYNNTLNNLLPHKSEFVDFNIAISNPNKKLFEVADYALENGIDKAKNKYKQHFTELENIKQGNVYQYF